SARKHGTREAAITPQSTTRGLRCMPRLILPSTLKDFFFDELWHTPSAIRGTGTESLLQIGRTRSSCFRRAVAG
ncbi:MAG TPA: hypothetical protein VHM70_17020, partial [Polyangiaceae bacterium]|nr:hypothetical protein [Polyangiaceae bacterium]